MGRLIIYAIMLLCLFAVQVNAQESVYLIVDGQAMGDEVQVIEGKEIGLGLYIEAGHYVDGVGVFSKNLELQKLLQGILDKEYNRSETSRKVETGVLLFPPEDFEKTEVRFSLKYENFNGKKVAVKKDVVFAKGEKKEMPVEKKVILDKEIKAEPKIQEIVPIKLQNIEEEIQEIRLYINQEKEPKEIKVVGEEVLELRIDLPAGISIKRINIFCENEVISSYLQSLVPEKRGRTTINEQIFKKLKMPSKLPKDQSPCELLVGYADKEFEMQTYNYKFILDLQGSRIVNLFAESAPEKPKKVLVGLGLEDLTAEDITYLGLDKKVFFQALMDGEGMVPEMKEKVVVRKQIPFEKSLGAKGSPLNVSSSVYVYEYLYRGKILTKSKVILFVKGDVEKGELIVKISDAEWGDEIPEILGENVKWTFGAIPEDQEFSFIVNKDMQNETILAAAAGEKPGMFNWLTGIFSIFR